MAVAATEAALIFGRFELRMRERILLADGARVELGARAFDVLAALAQGDGALLTKDALMDAAWPGAVVEESNLHTQIGAIRRALGHERDAVITVAGRGYRFGLPVSRRAVAGHDAPRQVSLSLVVLPFLAKPRSAEAEAIADGVTESLTTDLSRALAGGTVASRTTAQAYGARTLGARQIGEELDVRYVLEGSVALGADRTRVNVQLIDAAADAHVWAERFDLGPGVDALEMQDVIVGRLARQVALRLVLAEARRAGNAAAADADSLALRGYGTAIMSRMSLDGVPVAREMFHRALALDAGNIEAAAGLSALEAYALANGYTPAGDRTARLAEAEALSARVLAAQPEHLGALRARAVVLRMQGNFEDAIVVAKAILALCPGDPPACREMGLNHLYLGDAAEALRWFQQAEKGGPQDPARWSWLQGLGRALLHLGRDAEAVAAFRIVVGTNPDWAFGHGLLAAALALNLDMEAARDRFAEFIRRVPDRGARTPLRQIPVPVERVSRAYWEQDARIIQVFSTLEEACA